MDANKFNLSNVAAVTEEGTEVIGHLTWYSVSQMLIERDELQKKLISSGLEEKWMPNPIRVHDAFRRATKEIQGRKRIGKDLFQNYLTREVYSDSDTVQRNIVMETVDQQGKRLDYNSESCIITLDKKAENITIFHNDPLAEEMAKEAERRFKIYRSNYSSQNIRVMLMEILKSLGQISVRPNGGVYFIPAPYSEELDKFCYFANCLSSAESFKVPLMNTKDNRNMVSKKLQGQIKTLINTSKLGLKGELNKNVVKETIAEAKRIVGSFNDYKKIVENDVDLIEIYVEELRKQTALMIYAL